MTRPLSAAELHDFAKALHELKVLDVTSDVSEHTQWLGQKITEFVLRVETAGEPTPTASQAALPVEGEAAPVQSDGFPIPTWDDFVEFSKRQDRPVDAFLAHWFRDVGGFDHANPEELQSVWNKMQQYYSQPHQPKPQANSYTPRPQQQSYSGGGSANLSRCPRCGQNASGPKTSEAHPDWAPYYLCNNCKRDDGSGKNLLWSSQKKWNELKAATAASVPF